MSVLVSTGWENKRSLVTRLLTDRIVDRRDPEYSNTFRIRSGSHSNYKFARNDWNGDPLEGFRSDPYHMILCVLSFKCIAFL
jgi:hypothetical protein